MTDPFAQSEDPPDPALSDPYTRNQETTTYGKLVNEIQTFHFKVYPYYNDYLNIRFSAPAEEERPSTFISQDSHQLAAGADFLVFPGQLFENFNSFEPPSSRVSRQRLGYDGDERSYGDFKFIKPSGGTSGGGGSFTSFRSPPTRLAVALKVSVRSINKSNNRPAVLGTFLKEIRVMGKLGSCPSVVDLLGTAFVEREAEVRPTLVVELALGNAVDFFRSPSFASSVTWKIKSHFSLNIADALRSLHAIDLIHADVKAKNVLIFPHIQTEFCAKLSDFGNCIPRGSSPPRAPGTTEYLPPECLGSVGTTILTDSTSMWFGNAHYRDIYTFGLFTWELVTDCEHDAPFRRSDIEINLLKYDDKGAAAKHLLAFVPDSTPQHFRNIICGTLATIPTQRMSLEDIIESLRSIVESPVPSPSSSTAPKDSLSVDTTSIDDSVVGRQSWVAIPWSLQKRLYEEAEHFSNQDMDNASMMDSKVYLAYCYILCSAGNLLRDSALEHIHAAAHHNPFHFVQGSQLTPFAAMLQLLDWKGLSDLLPNDPNVADDGQLSLTNNQFLGHIYSFGWKKLLMLACEAGSAEPEGSLPLESLRRTSEMVAVLVVKFLIAAGHKNIGQISAGDCGFTVLHYASFSGKPQLVSILLANGAEVDARDDRDRTALHLCCQTELLSDRASLDVSRVLVEHQRDAVNAVMATKLYTPLRFAVDVQKPELCEYLILNGADVNARAQYGSTPLQECAWVTGFYGNGKKGEFGSKDEQKALEIARILLSRGKVNVNERTCHNSVTALAIAAAHGNFFGMVSLLLDYGADPNTSCDILTALCSAVEHNNSRMFYLLLERGADPNFFVSDNFPLGMAVARGRDEMVSTLLDRGANVDVLHNGRSLVFWVINSNARTKIETLSLLLDHGAPVTQAGVSDHPPIMQAVDSKSFEDDDDGLIVVIDFLIGHGAELDAINHKGETALHYACQYRLERIIAHLLAAGSNVRIKTADGLSSKDFYLRGHSWAKDKNLPVLDSTVASLEFGWLTR